MSSPTKGDGRSKPDWGSPPPQPRPAPKAARPAPAAKAPKAPKPARAPKAPKAAAAQKAAKAPAKRAPAGTRPPQGRPPQRKRGQFHRRYGVVYDIEGPKVRMGVCWFSFALTAIIGGSLITAVLYSAVAAMAAAQMARAWRPFIPQPSVQMAASGALLMGLGASFGAGGAGLGLLGAVALAFVGAAGDGQSHNPRIADIGWTLQCAIAPGAVAMSMVLLTRLDQGSAIGLLLLVSAYETGDFIIGSGSTNPYEGPGAGAAGIVVITFILSTLPISALSFGQAWVFGGLVALLAPIGQLLASALLPASDSPAPALRRFDSLLLTAPIWAWGVGLFL